MYITFATRVLLLPLVNILGSAVLVSGKDNVLYFSPHGLSKSDSCTRKHPCSPDAFNQKMVKNHPDAIFHLDAGTYGNGPITVGHNQRLYGNSSSKAATVISDSIRLTGANSRLKDIWVINDGSQLTGVYLLGASNISLERVRIGDPSNSTQSYRQPIVIYASNNITLTDLTIAYSSSGKHADNLPSQGITISGDGTLPPSGNRPPLGITIVDSRNVLAQNSDFSQNDKDFEKFEWVVWATVQNSTGINLEGNQVKLLKQNGGCIIALSYNRDSEVKVINNTFTFLSRNPLCENYQVFGAFNHKSAVIFHNNRVTFTLDTPDNWLSSFGKLTFTGFYTEGDAQGGAITNLSGNQIDFSNIRAGGSAIDIVPIETRGTNALMVLRDNRFILPSVNNLEPIQFSDELDGSLYGIIDQGDNKFCTSGVCKTLFFKQPLPKKAPKAEYLTHLEL